MNNKYKIFPKYALKYMFFLIIIWSIIFFIIDKAMPQYYEWKIEDDKIKYD